MARTMVAVDIGGSGVRAVQFTTGKKGPTVRKLAFAPMPESLVVDGEVRDVDGLAQVLKALWAEHKLGSREVVFGLGNNHTVVRMADFDWMPDTDFERSLRYQASGEHFDYAPDEAIWCHHTLNEFSVPDPEDGGTRRVRQALVVAARKDIVEGYVAALRGARLRPAKAEFTPFALIKAAQATPHQVVPPADTAEALIDMGRDLTTIVIHHGGQPRFVRIVSGQSGRHLTTTLAGQFANWKDEDAERTKIELGLGPGDPLQQHPAQEVINHVVSSVIGEIRNSIDFFLAASPHIGGVHRVLLTGGGANLKGLPQRLGSELRLPVVVGSPVPHLAMARGAALPPGLTETQLSVSLGLALGAA